MGKPIQSINGQTHTASTNVFMLAYMAIGLAYAQGKTKPARGRLGVWSGLLLPMEDSRLRHAWAELTGRGSPHYSNVAHQGDQDHEENDDHEDEKFHS